jgi:hypothetical protein
MSLLNVLNKLSEHIPQPFLAPIPQSEIVSCFTLQETIPYWFHLTNPQPGWWWLKPHRNEAVLNREAEPHEYLSYLSQLPRWIVIVIEQNQHGVVVVPYNASDATQRGWLNSEPRYVYLTRKVQLQTFSVVCVRNMAGTLLFDDFYPLDIEVQKKLTDGVNEQRPVVVPGHFSVVWQIAFRRMAEERDRQLKEEIERKRKEAQLTEEGRIRYRLEYVGAELVEYKKRGERFDVTYEYNGARFTMNVRPDMRIESAGICLSGEDSNHDLSSIVLTMERARELHRPGIERYHL